MRKIIHTEAAPSPVGPYNQAVQAGPVLFISGQIAIDPATGKMKIGDIRQETHQVMQNIKAVLDEAGLGFSDVVKCSIFVRNMDLYGTINQVYSQYFDEESAPARELVEVSALPKSAAIEISVIAYKP